MKKAFSYIRISEKDQSNFSLEGQSEYNQRYATQNNVVILDQFVDDGFSAKNFDRPSWTELYKLLTKHQNEISFLLVAKYDRLIRNAAQGLAMLEEVEQKYGVKIISTTECYFIDPHSPAFFKFRADLFVNAEFELRVIRDRSRFGNYRARSSGRYINRAPIGYQNKRDEKNKPIIVPNADAPKIKRAFEMYLRGFTYAQIKEAIKINRSGNEAIKRLLQNPTYAGMIKVGAYRENKATIVEGIHEGIISKDVWYKVQNKIQNGERPHNVSLSEDLPLRGYLKCGDCQRTMTGARSKGRSAYYFYYRCESCSRKNINVKKVDGWVEETLHSLEFDIPAETWEYYLKKNATEIIAEKKRDYNQARLSMEEVVIDLDKLEEKFIQDKIDLDVYTKWKSKYTAKREDLQTIMLNSQVNLNIDRDLIRSVIHRLSNVFGVYDTLDAIGKQNFLDLIMLGGLYAHKDYLQTAQLNSLFRSNDKEFKYLRINKIDNIIPISAGIPVSTRGGT